MLNLSEDFLCGDYECKVEVPRPDFTTQGVSSRRDVDYCQQYSAENDTVSMSKWTNGYEHDTPERCWRCYCCAVGIRHDSKFGLRGILEDTFLCQMYLSKREGQKPVAYGLAISRKKIDPDPLQELGRTGQKGSSVWSRNSSL